MKTMVVTKKRRLSALVLVSRRFERHSGGARAGRQGKERRKKDFNNASAAEMSRALMGLGTGAELWKWVSVEVHMVLTA